MSDASEWKLEHVAHESSIGNPESMTAMPTGTITFLFSDVESSSDLWLLDQTVMGTALAEHDRILREVFAEHGGYVFTTAGDSFSVAFSLPQAAVGAALAAQERLLDATPGPRGPLHVRMALHSGVAEERDGDYFGPTLNTCARLMASAHGGQILASPSVEGLVRSVEFPESVQLRELGEYQLRDVPRSLRVFQVTAPMLRQDFPPLRASVALEGLPAALTSFVGREHEIAEVVERLQGHRLVTITGPGGAGKTRLAMQAVASTSSFPDGATFVPLDGLLPNADVAEAVASRLRAVGESGMVSAEALARFVAGKKMLLVLDNCEHLADQVADLSTTLLRSAPLLTVLATSREALAVPGESIITLASMTLPSRKAATLGEIRASDAGRLLLDRIVDSGPAAGPSDEDAPALAAICHGLDGLPLAIELAGTTASVLAPQQIAAQLDAALDILSSTRRRDERRRGTLRATIQWSYDLLDPREQQAFRRLAVFVGGCDLAGAEAVIASPGAPTGELLAALAGLVAKSLLTSTFAGGVARYRFLETIRAFAEEQLRAAGEYEEMKLRHARHYTLEASANALLTEGPRQMEAFGTLEADYDNLRAAMAYCLDAGRPEMALDIAVSLGPFWDAMQRLSEGIRWLTRCLDAAGPDDDHRLAGLRWLAELQNPNDLEAATISWREALTLARERGDRAVEGSALAGLAIGNASAIESVAQFEQARSIFEDIGDKTGLAMVLQMSGALERDPDRAMGLFKESLSLLESVGNQVKAVHVLYYLGAKARRSGRIDEATRWLERSLAYIAPLDTSLERVHARSELGQVARLRGDLAAAEAIFTECLEQFREAGDERCQARMMGGLGTIAVDRGDRDQALPLLQESIRITHRVRAPYNLVLCLDSLALATDGELAATFVGVARSARARLSITLAPAEEARHQRRADSIREGIGAEPFRAAEARGNSLTPEETVALATGVV